jgi:selenocysteine lyase/cysteine desulfurase
LGLDAVQERVAGLADRLRTELAEVPGVIVHDGGITRCGIVTFTLAGRETGGIKRLLADHAVNVSVVPRPRSSCLGTPPVNDMVVRASVHYYNTEAEVQRLVSLLR